MEDLKSGVDPGRLVKSDRFGDEFPRLGDGSIGDSISSEFSAELWGRFVLFSLLVIRNSIEGVLLELRIIRPY